MSASPEVSVVRADTFSPGADLPRWEPARTTRLTNQPLNDSKLRERQAKATLRDKPPDPEYVRAGNQQLNNITDNTKQLNNITTTDNTKKPNTKTQTTPSKKKIV